MRKDFLRLLVVLGACLAIGLVVDQVLLCLLAGFAGYQYWQYRKFDELLRWLQKPSEHPAPESSGLVDVIARRFDVLRSQHKQRKKKLSGFLKRFQKASAALPDAVIILGEHDRIEWANKKAGKYFGIRWPQDVEQRISNLIRYPEIHEFLEKSRGKGSDRRLEIISPFDPQLRLEIRMAPYGKNHRLLVARNITRLHRINQMRSDFIANASHELRTPLTVISGYLESVDLDDDDCDETIGVVQLRQIRNQTERMRRLIEDLLKLASLESENKPDDMEYISVAEMIDAILADARIISGESKHRFNINADASINLEGNRKELHSAFSNLILNAVRYSPADSEIDINWYLGEEAAIFEVSDNGEGIAPEHLPRLTERFYRVDAGRSRDKGGTGLGLAIVKHTLARHQARLEIESEPGRGSIFRCVFPKHSIAITESPPILATGNGKG